MEIKVEDYVRTKYGNIGKIIEQDDYNVVINSKNNMELFISKEDNIKSSSNIIDLIEVGDYVNGELIVDIGINMDNEKVIFYIIPSDYCEDWFKEENIKSIVTKEQFKNMEYRIGE
ncbi:hypothetical protein IKS57_05615 [bacterium]|nr:hypothetical protein [bacterium]